MKIKFQICFVGSTENNEAFEEIEISEAIRLFNEFDWEKAQNRVLEKLTNGNTVDDSDSIIFMNSDKIKLSIESFDNGIYVAAIFKEKRMLWGIIPEIINGSPKLTQSDIVEMIQSFFSNDFKNLNNLCDRTRENSEFDIGQNALIIEQQANQYLKDLQTDIRKKKINDSISNLSFISWTLIGFGIFSLYMLAFRIRGNDYLLKGFMLIVGGLMIWGGVIILTKIKKHRNS